MAAQWPLVKAHLVSILPTLTGWSDVTVFSGAPTTVTDPTVFATVGFVADDQSGAFTSAQSPDGFQREETGTIRCQLACNSGDDDLVSPEAQAFALYDAVDTYVRAHRTLDGVLSPEGTSDLAVEVLGVQGADGAAVSLVLTLTYYTVT